MQAGGEHAIRSDIGRADIPVPSSCSRGLSPDDGAARVIPLRRLAAALLAASALVTTARAETIRVAIGTQDTTINCATGGLLIRELKLLEKYLPHDGKYKDVTYDIQWKNFTSGAPLTNEMVAGKLDFGAMADFPGSLNGAAFPKAGQEERVHHRAVRQHASAAATASWCRSTRRCNRCAELKGKTISVPFASTAHGMLLRAVKAQGWDPETRREHHHAGARGGRLRAARPTRSTRTPTSCPSPNCSRYRGFARKIYDGAQANAPTFHGTLVDAATTRRSTPRSSSPSCAPRSRPTGCSPPSPRSTAS